MGAIPQRAKRSLRRGSRIHPAFQPELLELASPPVYFGSSGDRISSRLDLESAEAAAAPWVLCVDYDQAGFRGVDAETGPLGRAVRGSKQFHIAEPWLAAGYRVHISRGVSNHLYAGWTGSLKGLIGLLSRLPHRSDLVVQGLPKIGLGGGPDAYCEVRDVGLIVAGADEVSVDLTALRHAGIPGHPWTFNHPIHGALQFGGGSMCWDEIRTATPAARRGASYNNSA